MPAVTLKTKLQPKQRPPQPNNAADPKARSETKPEPLQPQVGSVVLLHRGTVATYQLQVTTTETKQGKSFQKATKVAEFKLKQDAKQVQLVKVKAHASWAKFSNPMSLIYEYCFEKSQVAGLGGKFSILSDPYLLKAHFTAGARSTTPFYEPWKEKAKQHPEWQYDKFRALWHNMVSVEDADPDKIPPNIQQLDEFPFLDQVYDSAYNLVKTKLNITNPEKEGYSEQQMTDYVVDAMFIEIPIDDYVTSCIERNCALNPQRLPDSCELHLPQDALAKLSASLSEADNPQTAPAPEDAPASAGASAPPAATQAHPVATQDNTAIQKKLEQIEHKLIAMESAMSTQLNNILNRLNARPPQATYQAPPPQPMISRSAPHTQAPQPRRPYAPRDQHRAPAPHHSEQQARTQEILEQFHQRNPGGMASRYRPRR